MDGTSTKRLGLFTAESEEVRPNRVWVCASPETERPASVRSDLYRSFFRLLL